MTGAQHPAVQRLQFFLSEARWVHERVNARRLELRALTELEREVATQVSCGRSKRRYRRAALHERSHRQGPPIPRPGQAERGQPGAGGHYRARRRPGLSHPRPRVRKSRYRAAAASPRRTYERGSILGRSASASCHSASRTAPRRSRIGRVTCMYPAVHTLQGLAGAVRLDHFAGRVQRQPTRQPRSEELPGGDLDHGDPRERRGHRDNEVCARRQRRRRSPRRRGWRPRPAGGAGMADRVMPSAYQSS